MSFHAVLWACRQELTPVPKLILVALSTFASKVDGSCFPKIATIGKMASVSSRTVHRRLPELVNRELIRIQPNFNGRAHLPHTYWLACGGDGRSKADFEHRRDRRGDDISNRSNNHYQNHDSESQRQAPPLARSLLARQGSKIARRGLPTTTKIDQETQVELARRLGPSGWEILMAFDEEVGRLCFRLRKGMLTDEDLSQLRRRYATVCQGKR